MRAFRRNKASPRRKVVAAALCNAGYSYREVASMVGGISHVAAREAYLSLVTSLPPEERKSRKEVAIDGSEVALDGRSYYIWLARDVDSGEFLSFQGSPTGSAEDGDRFLAAVAAQCSNRPIIRLGSEPNRPKGLLNLDLYFQSSSSLSFVGRISRIFLGTAP
jgi:transposase-like protein